MKLATKLYRFPDRQIDRQVEELVSSLNKATQAGVLPVPIEGDTILFTGGTWTAVQANVVRPTNSSNSYRMTFRVVNEGQPDQYMETDWELL